VELWSFIPTEAILKPWYLDDIDHRGAPNERRNPHPRLVDGAPVVYFNPRGRLAPAGPAVCRKGDTALLVFGLGKGGRSTYCLDVADPLRPALRWALRPDEVTPTGNPVVRSMGLATCRPAFARALNAQGRVADFLVLGGGLSTPDIEDGRNWTEADPPRPFGRSLVLFDVNRGPGGYRTGPGDLVAHGAARMASVPAGAVPLEWFRGGGLAQRIYCADRAGAIWVLALAGPGDSSQVGAWVLRPVFRPRDGTVMSTLPEVFTLPQGRIPGTLTPAVGIVAGTGDRDNPSDEPSGPGPGRAPERLFLVYDAHDPARYPEGLDERHLADLTHSTEADPAQVLQVAAGTLRPALLGLSLDLPAGARVLHDPLVTHGALFLSLFTPREDPRDPCARAGLTETWRFAGPWSAWFGRGVRGAVKRQAPWAAALGRQAEAAFRGLAGELAPQADGQVGQIGVVPEVDGDAPAPVVRAYRGRDPSRGLRIRAWRVVH
jgi:Tfp pilus tip-associated adhesin PilY1